MENEKENPKDIVNLVLKAVALAMGVVVVTLSILGVMPGGAPVLLLGLVFLIMWRWTLPPGSLTLLFGLNAVAMSVFNDQYSLIAPLAVAGVCGDGLLNSLRPSLARPRAESPAARACSRRSTWPSRWRSS